MFGITFIKNIGNAVTRNKLKRRVKSIIDNNENKSSKKIYQLGLILVVITIGVFAFLLDRFARRKYKVNSLLIDYDNPQAWLLI